MLDIKLHEIQNKIFTKIITTQGLRFNQLLIDDLDSELINYHIKRLVTLNLIQKEGNLYKVTEKGKEVSNLIDDTTLKIEHQPKTSILIYGVKKLENGEIAHLLTQRLKHPYYGLIGRLTGKVRFGEGIKEAAKRELLEETGLTANFLELEEIYHKQRFKQGNICVQDVIFYIFFAKDFTGEFIEKTSFQRNLWLTQEMLQKSDYKTFHMKRLKDRYEPKELKFTKDIDEVSNF